MRDHDVSKFQKVLQVKIERHLSTKITFGWYPYAGEKETVPDIDRRSHLIITWPKYFQFWKRQFPKVLHWSTLFSTLADGRARHGANVPTPFHNLRTPSKIVTVRDPHLLKNVYISDALSELSPPNEKVTSTNN